MRPAWAQAARASLSQGPAALITILGVEGSSPREAGTRMVVTAEGQAGSIGGGTLEKVATGQARAILGRPPGAWRVQDYPLGPLLGQCCGGRVRLLVERLDPADAGWLDEVRSGSLMTTRFAPERLERRAAATGDPAPPIARGPAPQPGDVIVERMAEPSRPVIMFGAGHVGRAIAKAAEDLPFSLTWFDVRPEVADAPGVVVTDEPVLLAAALDAGADDVVLILTHDHALDFRLTVAALNGRSHFVGLIGSATKRARFASRLAKEGLGGPALERLVCPIGLHGVVGKEPAVIAVAVMAQLLSLRSLPC
jgi:xanthine dehydrogenase accessory factor